MCNYIIQVNMNPSEIGKVLKFAKKIMHAKISTFQHLIITYIHADVTEGHTFADIPSKQRGSS